MQATRTIYFKIPISDIFLLSLLSIIALSGISTFQPEISISKSRDWFLKIRCVCVCDFFDIDWVRSSE